MPITEQESKGAIILSCDIVGFSTHNDDEQFTIITKLYRKYLLCLMNIGRISIIFQRETVQRFFSINVIGQKGKTFQFDSRTYGLESIGTYKLRIGCIPVWFTQLMI